jgi:dipeptidyl aminopeptidase/acylaminoacyl peptidase
MLVLRRTNMRAALLLVFLTVSVMMAVESHESARQEKHQKRYNAPDGGLTALVTPISKEAGRSEYESRIEFKSIDGKIACAIDYSSADSEHGFGVVKAEWTPDSQYFVFSLTSSGGHQPWHAPTQFLSREDGKIRTLDDYVDGAGISNADFQLIAPNTVKTEVWKNQQAVAVTLKLDALPAPRSWRMAKPFTLDCAGSTVFKPEQP